MGTRTYGKPRCEGCGLWPSLCLCDRIPRVELPSRVLVVQRYGERFKPTNTAKLLLAALPHSERVYFGLRDQVFDTRPITDHGPAYLLFPDEEAIPANRLPPLPVPHTFVVLDGTWHQCSRMRHRVPAARDLPRVTLPPGPPSIWPARAQHDPRGLSTFEAVARLLEAVHGSEAAAPLHDLFADLCDRLAHMRDPSRPLVTPRSPRRADPDASA